MRGSLRGDSSIGSGVWGGSQQHGMKGEEQGTTPSGRGLVKQGLFWRMCSGGLQLGLGVSGRGPQSWM